MSGGGEQPGRAPGGRRPWELLVSTGNLEYDRVLFFTDAIFAIAITLLVVDIRVTGGRTIDEQLRDALPQMLGFGISFLVIGTFWVSHHGIFRHIAALDRRLIWLNLLFAGTIAFMPYPTALLSQPGNHRAAIVFYAAWVAAAALAESAIWIYACRAPGAITAETPQWMRRYFALRMLRVPAVFLVSIPVAFFAQSSLVPYVWLAVAPLGIAIRRVAGPPGDPGGSDQEYGEDGQAA